jgi:hypothetical protein
MIHNHVLATSYAQQRYMVHNHFLTTSYPQLRYMVHNHLLATSYLKLRYMIHNHVLATSYPQLRYMIHIHVLATSYPQLRYMVHNHILATSYTQLRYMVESMYWLHLISSLSIRPYHLQRSLLRFGTYTVWYIHVHTAISMLYMHYITYNASIDIYVFSLNNVCRKAYPITSFVI